MKHPKPESILIFANFLFLCDSSDPLCALSIPAVPLSPPDIKQIKSFIESQDYGPNFLDNALVSNIKTAEDVLAYNNGLDNEDSHLYITDLIEKYGYKCEEHKVETSDGYILTLQRIIGNGSVVFLLHGIFSSADDFVTVGPDNGIPYSLAAAGYDVWLGNVRGNKHSRQHVTLSPDCADFWDFSWDEMGRIDVPTMIDYVLETTGQSKVTYIGHSQGTSCFFVMCSKLPEYNKKISLMIALAPVVFLSHVRSPLFRILALNTGLEYKLLSAIGINEVVPANGFTETLASILCNNPFCELVCSNFLFLLAGFSRGHLNATCLPVVFGHTPAGASTKQLVHFEQLIQSGRFCRFDYGEAKNKEEYGSKTPPDYPLEKAEAPVALFYSDNDWQSNVTDAMILRNKLPNVVDFRLFENFCHFDYLFANNLKQVLNAKILELIKEYQ